MNTPQITNRQLLEFVKTYWQWRTLWFASTAVFAVASLFYVLFLKSDTWVASQGLIVRDEANGAVMRLGRFQSQTEMKAAQETVLEMAQNAQVLREALTKVGRPPKFFGLFSSNSPPTSQEIDALAKNGIEVRAPRGAELGTTEVIYLDVKQSTQSRAQQLNKAVCDALENQLQAVRQARADGVVAELSTATDSAKLKLEEATAKLQQMESEAGADLSDLRGMTDSNSGGNTSRQLLNSLKSEIRAAELQQQQLAIDLELATESYENPNNLLLTPSRLVTSQPGLQKLREGLANATLATAELKGRFKSSHPRVRASVEAESLIRQQLRSELGLSVQSLKRDADVANRRIENLRQQQQQIEARLNRIAQIRADYGNVISEVKARNEQLESAERELAQAVASRDAAVKSSLITRLDEPIIGETPIGPGRSTIVLGSTLSGLFFGLGVVFLLTPLDGKVNYGRRAFDYARRRESDRRDSPEGAQVASYAASAPETGLQEQRSESREERTLEAAKQASSSQEAGQSAKRTQPDIDPRYVVPSAEFATSNTQRTTQVTTQSNSDTIPSSPPTKPRRSQGVATQAESAIEVGSETTAGKSNSLDSNTNANASDPAHEANIEAARKAIADALKCSFGSESANSNDETTATTT